MAQLELRAYVAAKKPQGISQAKLFLYATLVYGVEEMKMKQPISLSFEYCYLDDERQKSSSPFRYHLCKDARVKR